MCQEGYNKLCCYYHHECTYDLDPTDSGAGNQIRFWFGVYLDEWIWDYGNIEQWYLGLLPASYEQILINYIRTKAWIQVFHSLGLLREISLRWGAVCTLLDKTDTLYFYRISIPVIIYLYMIMMKIMLLFWYIPLQRVHIKQRLRCHMRRWLILW